jgi:acetyl-CoA carboxylase carboxyltransferase component
MHDNNEFHSTGQQVDSSGRGMDDSILRDLAARREAGRALGSRDALDKLRESGKLNARERLDILLDPGSFEEIGVLARSQSPMLRERTPADGIVAGWGTIDGRKVYVTSEDFSVLAGTRGRVAETKAARIRELAWQHKRPFIALMEAGAGRFQELNGAAAAIIGHRFREHHRMSGRIPQVAAIMGACFGGPSFTAAQSDFVPIVRGKGFFGMSGPPVVKVGIGEVVTAEELGGADKAAGETGQVDLVTDTDEQALLAIRQWLSFFPSNCDEAPPTAPPRPAAIDSEAGRLRIAQMVSENPRRGYNMRELVELLVDGGELFAYRPAYGPNLLTAWGRVRGQTVGIAANNPMHMAGALDFRGASKLRKFVELCDAFHVPLVFLTDCPGFLVGSAVERTQMVSLASRLLNTLAGATVPRITIVLRKAIGLAYIAMGGRTMNPDALVAWPTARFDVMGPAAGVELVYGKEIARSDDPQAKRSELLKQMDDEAHAFVAGENAFIDEVIHPAETRDVIVSVLERTRGNLRPCFKHRIDP